MRRRGARRIGAAKASGLALAVLVPLVGLVIHALASRPLAEELSLATTIKLAYAFASIPALVVFASVGARLGAQRSTQSRARALRIATTKGGLTGLGLGLLVAIPVGALDQDIAGWVPLLLVCAAVSAAVGAGAALWIYRGETSEPPPVP